jgi:hypothetical protein
MTQQLVTEADTAEWIVLIIPRTRKPKARLGAALLYVPVQVGPFAVMVSQYAVYFRRQQCQGNED